MERNESDGFLEVEGMVIGKCISIVYAECDRKQYSRKENEPIHDQF
jgi:hypothetical protein